MAIVSLVALLVALGLAALLSLQPWAPSQVGPRLSLGPGLGIALEDSVAVAPGGGPVLADARPAAGGHSRLAAGEPVAGRSAQGPRLGLASARQVSAAKHDFSPVPAPEAPVPEEVPPPPAPAAAPISIPVVAPVAAVPPGPAVAPDAGGRAGPGSGGQGPSSAGGNPGGGFVSGPVPLYEDDEYALSFHLFVQPATFPAPGTDNLIVRFEDATGAPPSFGLQLWDDGSGGRGLWASGEAAAGERFLAAVEEGVRHEVVVYFRASSEDDGFYLVFLDGEPIDARAAVSLLAPGEDGLAEVGLFRDGERVVGATDVLVGPARLSDTLEPVIP